MPVALTIAGSDCSAGAGLQADLKTFSALGVYGLTAVTCGVAEVPGKGGRIQAIGAAEGPRPIGALPARGAAAAGQAGLVSAPRGRELGGGM